MHDDLCNECWVSSMKNLNADHKHKIASCINKLCTQYTLYTECQWKVMIIWKEGTPITQLMHLTLHQSKLIQKALEYMMDILDN